jgi:hypothetical protein
MEIAMSIAEVLENPVPVTVVDDSELFTHWSASKAFALRASAFFFLLVFTAPLDWKFWRSLFHSNFLHFQDLFRLTAAIPQYISAPKWGFASFANTYLVLAVAVIGAAAWGLVDRKQRDYDLWYYWLNVALRYRLAIGLIGYGLLQVFAIQFPRPTLSDLYTNYGDYLQWKLYYLTNGVAHAHYQEFLGIVEVVAGALLLWRPTVSIGAIFSASLLFNIVLANFVYQLGDHIYATLLLLAAAFLLLHDTVRLANLLILQRRARADHFEPPFYTAGALRLHRIGKGAVIAFLAFYAGSVAYGSWYTSWPFPSTPGVLKNAAGFYNVREFTLNGNTIPYSLTDPVRWQNVVFETWNTVSIRSNRAVSIEVANPPIEFGNDKYEYAGNAGRRFYSYNADPAAQTIYLQAKTDPHESYSFHYQYAPDGSLLLTGNDESGESLNVVLEKQQKQFLLELGRRHPLTIY